MFRRLSALVLVLSVLSSASYGEEKTNLITILEMNLDSSPQEIESVLGKCEQREDYPKAFVCGRGDKAMSTYWGGYEIKEVGSTTISVINIPCSYINGCEYSEADLANIISQKLGLSEPQQKYKDALDPKMGAWMIMYGEAGDSLTVQRLIDDYFGVSIGEHNYRKQSVTLN